MKDKKATAEGGRPLYLEDDYESAIARNIAVEILKNRYVPLFSRKKISTKYFESFFQFSFIGKLKKQPIKS